MISQGLAPIVVWLLLLWGSYRIAEGADDSFRLLEMALVSIIAMCAFASMLFVPYSFPALLGQLSPPVLLGVIAGSWPDARIHWPARLRRGLPELARGAPSFGAGALGIAVGIWVWAALAAAWGLAGAILGIFVFVLVVVGVTLALFAAGESVSSWWKRFRDEASPQ